MRKTEKDTFGLASASALLELERDDLLYFITAESRPLGKLPCIRNHNPYGIRFTWRQIQLIKRRLKNYKPEPLDFEAIERVLKKYGC